MPRPTTSVLPHTTSTNPVSDATRWLAESVEERDVHGIRLSVHDGADPSAECCSTTLLDGTEFKKLTAASLAALIDADDDQLLLLPLLLNVGADINQVDSQGRTLQHFARTRRVARYLIKHGVPVAPNMRSALLDAFTRPHGEETFGKDIELGIRDKAGNEPWIFRAVRKQTARHWRLSESPAVPKRLWRKALASYSYNELVGIGFNESEEARKNRDVLYVEDESPSTSRARPPLVAEISATRELNGALGFNEHRRVKVLLDIGASPTLEKTVTGIEIGDRIQLWSDVTDVGRAVLIACDAILHPKSPKPGAHTPKVWDDGLPARARTLAAFAGRAELIGVHPKGGRTLMHLAYVPEVAQWLINQGVPVDVPDKRGRLPEEVVPPDAASVILNARLQQTLPVPSASSARRGRL